jgi:GT2 family glycosyltransferase
MIAGPKVAVVVPVHNKVGLTLQFLDSFARVHYANHQIIIVDDGSTDETATALAQSYPEVTVLKGDGSLWWAGGNNLGVRYALERDYQYVLTINNDTRVDPAFLSYLVETAESYPRSIVGSRINFIDEPTKVWAVGSFMNWRKGSIFHLSDHGQDEERVLARRPNPCPVEILTGCGTLVPVDCYREVGLYDDRHYPQYHADSEFILRATTRGYRAWVDLRAVVWNDAGNTCAGTIARYYDFFFSRRSAVYWRPLLAIHLRYCPRRYLLSSLVRHYAWFLWYNDPKTRKLKNFVKRMLPVPAQPGTEHEVDVPMR